MDVKKLKDLIGERFDLGELRELSFNLGIEYENLPGITRNEKATSLVQHCERRGWFPKLLTECKTTRPDLSWQEATKTIEQWPPQLRGDKLAFLCWVYIKSDGSIWQYVESDTIATLMELSQLDTIPVAEYLASLSLLEFETWYMGIKITHQGIVKIEHDLLEGFTRDEFPVDLISNVKILQKKRLDFLRYLYKLSKPLMFKPVSGIEIANGIGLEHRQAIIQGILNFLNDQGWLRFRGLPSIQITEKGVEMVEAEEQQIL